MPDVPLQPGESPREPGGGARRHGAWAALLLCLHLALLADGARRDAATFDEPLFIAAGLASWQGAHQLFGGGGALPQRLAGLGPLLSGATLPDDPAAWASGDATGMGFELLRPPGPQARWLLFVARLPVALASVALGAWVFLATRRLFGGGSALLALALHASSPVFLAHGRLATADLLAAATLPVSAWLAHRCLQRLTWGRALASCLAFSLAVLAKMSVVLVPPVIALLVVLRCAARVPTQVGAAGRAVPAPSTRWFALVGALVVGHALAAVLATWAAHDFRFAATPEGESSAWMESEWEIVERSSALAPVFAAARAHRVLPEAWIFGLQFTLHWAEERRSYLEGRVAMTGWWWFFPRVFVLKTPLIAMALACLGLAAFASAWKRQRPLSLPDPDESEPTATWARAAAGRDLLALAPMIAFVAVYGAAALQSNLNVGFRHLLPILPAFHVLGGAAWRLGARSARTAAAIALLAVLATAEGLSSHPHHVAWMNLSAGPEERRWTHLVDSSLDWGQALREAAYVVKAEALPGEVVHLSYFGQVDPAAEGLHANGLSGYGDRWRWAAGERWPESMGATPGAGLYLVSATCLVQLWSPVCPGDWRPAYEEAWRASTERMAPWSTSTRVEQLALLFGPEGARWRSAVVLHDHLQMGRLAASLRRREPLRAIGGGAMLLYRLDAGQVEDALHGPLPGWEPLTAP